MTNNKTIIFDNKEYDVSRITIGLGWNIREKQPNFLDRYIFDDEVDFDLDAIAFLMDKNDRVINLGKDLHLTGGRKVPFQKSDVIYFHNLTAPSGNLGAYYNSNQRKIENTINKFVEYGEYVIHTGDNLVGSSDEEHDAEQLIVMTNKMPLRISKILFLVCIYKGKERAQHFGQIENAYIRAIDANGKEMARFEFSSEETFENKCSLTFGELYRGEDNWVFKTNINAYETDNFVDILRKYIRAATVHYK